jgi:hypothetical protein
MSCHPREPRAGRLWGLFVEHDHREGEFRVAPDFAEGSPLARAPDGSWSLQDNPLGISNLRLTEDPKADRVTVEYDLPVDGGVAVHLREPMYCEPVDARQER